MGPRVTSALLVALVAGLSGCRSERRSAVVPWRNRPLPLYRMPDARLVRFPASGPPCRAAELRVRQGRTAVGLGNRLEELVFVNLGRRPCLLRGSPEVSAVGPDGRRRILHVRRGGTYFGRLEPADLRPGRHVFLDFATSAACDGGSPSSIRLRDLVFTLPDGGRVPGRRISLVEECGLSISDFGLPRRYAPPRPAAPGTVGTLVARPRLPTSVRAGSTLRFIVTLTNPTDEPVRLRPCPGYTEAVVTSTRVFRRSYALDCETVDSIPAHRAAPYAMELAVPEAAKPGIAKVAWNLNTPNGPFTAGVVGVSAARA